MGYKLTINKKEKYTLIKVSGKDSLSTSLAYWKEVLSLVKNEGWEKILVEEDLVGNVSTTETYKISSAMTEYATGTSVKIAFYDKQPGHENINKFGETVALTRGVYISVLASLQEAEKYLLDD